MTAPAEQHDPQPTPDQDETVAAVAALLLVAAAAALTVAAIWALLRKRGLQVSQQAVQAAYGLATARTGHVPRTIGRSDTARAQARVEASYRAAYVVNASQRIQARVDAALAELAAGSAGSQPAGSAGWDDGDAGAAARRDDDARAAAAARAIRDAARTERRYEAAHEKARRRRLEAAVDVAVAADLHGPLLGWHATDDDRTTPECRAADGTNFRADRPPLIGWPGTLHGGTCRCEPGAPFPYARTTDEATGLAGLTRRRAA